jgi:hypothetical protein
MEERMFKTILVKRTLENSAPSQLEFGELAFSDGSDRLHVGKADGSILSGYLSPWPATALELIIDGAVTGYAAPLQHGHADYAAAAHSHADYAAAAHSHADYAAIGHSHADYAAAAHSHADYAAAAHSHADYAAIGHSHADYAAAAHSHADYAAAAHSHADYAAAAHSHADYAAAAHSHADYAAIGHSHSVEQVDGLSGSLGNLNFTEPIFATYRTGHRGDHGVFYSLDTDGRCRNLAWNDSYFSLIVDNAAFGITPFLSDRSLKENIIYLSEKTALLNHQKCLDRVCDIPLVEFDWKPGIMGTGHQHVGVIAQDLSGILPGWVNTLPDGKLQVNETQIIPYLIGAIQELSAKLQSLEPVNDEF